MLRLSGIVFCLLSFISTIAYAYNVNPFAQWYGSHGSSNYNDYGQYMSERQKALAEYVQPQKLQTGSYTLGTCSVHVVASTTVPELYEIRVDEGVAFASLRFHEREGIVGANQCGQGFLSPKAKKLTYEAQGPFADQSYLFSCGGYWQDRLVDVKLFVNPSNLQLSSVFVGTRLAKWSNGIVHSGPIKKDVDHIICLQQ